MKNTILRLLSGILLVASVNSAYAISPKLRINWSTTDAAKYADGTDVLDGERFILVWTAPGVTFDLSKDITGDVNSFLGNNWRWLDIQASSAGKVDPAKTFLSTDTTYVMGTARVYLLDTRISATQLAPLGKNKFNEDFPTVVKGAALISGATFTWSGFDTNPHTISGPAPEKTAWVMISTEPPTPVIVSMVLANDVATVGVTNTLSTVNYILKGSLDLTFTNTFWEADSKAGAADALTPLVLSDTSATNAAAFYRIETTTK